ncbi:MAG: hypothetical protein KGJ94_05435 [Xanthomonadaceae bacterium]|nr:hypothetical protein [Xanthomonadaceae bacterium]
MAKRRVPNSTATSSKLRVKADELKGMADGQLLLEEKRLFAKAKTGDRQVATALFNNLRRCEDAHLDGKLKESSAMTRTGIDTSRMSAEQWAAYERELNSQARSQMIAQRAQELCKGMGDVGADGSLYWVTLYAANAGDAMAANCLVEGIGLPNDFTRRPDLVQSYRQNSLRIAQQQISVGNVDMVQILTTYYGGIPGSVSSYVVPADPEKHYMYLQLLNLIAGIQSPVVLQDRVAAAGAKLDAAAREALDGKAQRIFDQYFGIHQSVGYPPQGVVCNNADL